MSPFGRDIAVIFICDSVTGMQKQSPVLSMTALCYGDIDIDQLFWSVFSVRQVSLSMEADRVKDDKWLCGLLMPTLLMHTEYGLLQIC